MLKYYPSPICSDCADKIGGRMPEGHICGWWVSECDVCKEVKSVTSSRDWRYPSIEVAKSHPGIHDQFKTQNYDKKK